MSTQPPEGFTDAIKAAVKAAIDEVQNPPKPEDDPVRKAVREELRAAGIIEEGGGEGAGQGTAGPGTEQAPAETHPWFRAWGNK